MLKAWVYGVLAILIIVLAEPMAVKIACVIGFLIGAILPTLKDKLK